MHLPETGTSEDGFLVTRRQAWYAFVLSFLLMTFDFIDRQIVVSLFPYLKAEWALSDGELGALVSVVSLAVAIGTVPLSLLADSWGRVKSVVAMALVWSLATIACGLAKSFPQFFLARSVIGLGEAGYGPAAGAILSSTFPKRLRATIIGAFLAAASFGSVFGVLLGGLIAVRWGWKTAFGIVGLPGLVLAGLYAFVRDYQAPALGASDTPTGPHKLLGVAYELFRARSGIAAYFAGALQLVTASAILAWLPSFFNRAYGIAPDQAGIWAAAVVLCATIGAVFWAALSDKLAQRDIRYRMLVPAACCFTTMIVFAIAFGMLSPGLLQVAGITSGAFLMTAATGPVPAVAVDVVHPALRTTAGSVVTVVQNLFGLGVGPLLSGFISDAFGLQTAMALIPISCAFAALLLVLGARSYARDRAALATLVVRFEKSQQLPSRPQLPGTSQIEISEETQKRNARLDHNYRAAKQARHEATEYGMPSQMRARRNDAAAFSLPSDGEFLTQSRRGGPR